MNKLLNLGYGLSQGSFWMTYGCISSFVSVFLLGRGYSNSEIGIILAAANVLAVVLQPIIANFTDRTKKFSIMAIMEIMTVILMIMGVGLFTLKGKSLALSVVFVLLIAWHTTIQPLINTLTFKLEEHGAHINFGICRSGGSLFYAILMAVLGTWTERYGESAISISAEATMVMLLISLYFTKKVFDKQGRESKGGLHEQEALKNSEQTVKLHDEISMAEFVSRNVGFMVLNLGVVGLYFSNAVLNSYMMQIVDSVGGDSEDMGRILSLMAFLEIPALFFFDNLKKHFTCQFMLKVASIGYFAKIFLCYLASSVGMVYFAQSFQVVAFALFLPAMVHFIDSIMTPGEAVRGQAVFTTMVTVTTTVSSVAGGFILDISSPKTLMLVSSVITLLGALIIIVKVDKINEHK